jgi:hypothetical protein
MNGNTNMRINQQVVEITGTPAQVWGNVLIPAGGSMHIKITGDTLQGTVKTGLEKREAWIRIQNIDSVEIQEAPIYALLALGVCLVLPALFALSESSIVAAIVAMPGAAILYYAIKYKRRYLAIHSYRNSLVIFMNKPPEVYQQFAMNVLALSRKLNMPLNPATKQPPTKVQV